MAPTPSTGPAGHRLHYWLGNELRETRNRSGFKMREAVALAELGATSLYRFENAVTWPDDVERVVAAYAALAEIDARLIWLRAVEKWLKHGSEPVLQASGELEHGDGKVPAAALQAMEEAIGAYVRDLEREQSRSAPRSRAATRAASSRRGRP